MTELIQALVKLGEKIGVKPVKVSPALAAEVHESGRTEGKGPDYTPISELVGKFAFIDELDRLNGVTVPQLTSLLEKAAGMPAGEIAAELGGLGLLAIPSADELQAKLRSKSPEEYKQKLFIKSPIAKPASELVGLGTLALPALSHLKHAAVSEEEALESLQRLHRLEEMKPTVGQVGRYATIGAASGPAIASLKHVIEGGEILGGAGKRLRGGAAAATAGALTSGAIPLVRSYMDRRAEIGKLKKFVQQEGT